MAKLNTRVVVIPLQWIEIPGKRTASIPNPKKYYLVAIEVANYLEKLENQLKNK